MRDFRFFYFLTIVIIFIAPYLKSLESKELSIPFFPSILKRVLKLKGLSSENQKVFLDWRNKFEKHLETMEEIRNGSVKATCQNIYERKVFLQPPKLPESLLSSDFRFKVFRRKYSPYLLSCFHFNTEYNKLCSKNYQDEMYWSMVDNSL